MITKLPEESPAEPLVGQPAGNPVLDTMPLQRSGSQNTDPLATQLRQKICSTDHNTSFLPLNALDDILAGKDNLAALQRGTGDPDDETVTFNKILSFVGGNDVPPSSSSSKRRGPGSKILTILLLIEKLRMIRRFILQDVTDECLPFQFTYKDGSWNIRSRQGRPIERLFLKWRDLDIDNFSKHQWSVLAPFFRKPDDKNPDKVYHYDFQKETILPFKSSEEESLNTGKGSYGTVFKVRIHPAHCDFDPSTNSTLAFGIKRLERSDETAFNNEVETLKRFSINTNNHLIQLLATYKWRNSYYLIFPWADKNLQGLWETIETPQNSLNLSLWMARQCHGLAVGLSNIHVYQSQPQNEIGVSSLCLPPQEKPYGRHNDIKHENVLWFKDHSKDAEEYAGELKISDFGFVKFNSEGSRSIIPTHNLFTPTYMPPECALPNHIISRSFDLWSLGCLYLEFVTWLLKGYTAATDEFIDSRIEEGRHAEVSEFQDDNFFIIRNNKVSLKDCVVACIESLHSDPRCTEYLHDFLDCIANQLLLPDPAQRISCGDLVQELDRILQKCQDDQEYCTKSDPRSNHKILRKSYDLRSSKNAATTLSESPAGQAEPLSGYQPQGASGYTGAKDGSIQQTTSDLDMAGLMDGLSVETTVSHSEDDVVARSPTIQLGSGESNGTTPKTPANQGQTDIFTDDGNIELVHAQNRDNTEGIASEIVGVGVRTPPTEGSSNQSRPHGLWTRICSPSSWGIPCIGRQRTRPRLA